MYSKMFRFLSVVLVLAFAETSVIKMTQELDTAPVPKVQVVAYIESLAEGCEVFLRDSLIPSYRHLADIMHLTILPFGNAEEHKDGDKYKFTCQNGYQECQGNIVETCVLHHYSNLTNNLDFMLCFQEDISIHRPMVWQDSLKRCAKHYGIDEGKIASCVNGDEGMELEHDVASQTGPHEYIPWAMVDGKHEHNWEYFMRDAICNSYKGRKPKYCCQETARQNVPQKSMTTAPKVQVVAYIESLSEGSEVFLQDSLIPAYRHLADIMHLTILPFGNAKEQKHGDKYNFTCVNGYEECQGNIVETCVLHHYSNVTNNLDFMLCFQQDISIHNPRVWQDSLGRCAKHYGIDDGKIASCVNGDEGMELEHDVASQTGPHEYIPWAMVDGKHEHNWEYFMRDAICNSYKGLKPEYCCQ